MSFFLFFRSFFSSFLLLLFSFSACVRVRFELVFPSFIVSPLFFSRSCLLVPSISTRSSCIFPLFVYLCFYYFSSQFSYFPISLISFLFFFLPQRLNVFFICFRLIFFSFCFFFFFFFNIYLSCFFLSSLSLYISLSRFVSCFSVFCFSLPSSFFLPSL